MRIYVGRVQGHIFIIKDPVERRKLFWDPYGILGPPHTQTFFLSRTGRPKGISRENSYFAFPFLSRGESMSCGMFILLQSIMLLISITTKLISFLNNTHTHSFSHLKRETEIRRCLRRRKCKVYNMFYTDENEIIPLSYACCVHLEDLF